MLKYVLALPLLFAFFAQPAHSQSRLDPVSSPPQVQKVAAYREAIISDNGASDEARQRLQQQLIARVIAERQAALRRDTEKLVALAAELKQHVDKTDANTLSMDVIKKAQEIQKLAKSVQDKMRNAY
jgi:hypothetical protein